MGDPIGVGELMILFVFVLAIFATMLVVAGGGSAMTVRYLISRFTGDRYVSERQLNMITCIVCVVVMYIVYRLYVVRKR